MLENSNFMFVFNIQNYKCIINIVLNFGRKINYYKSNNWCIICSICSCYK